MQYDLETTDVSLDLFGSAKSKLIDDKITKNRETPFLLMLRASTSAKNFLVSKNAIFPAAAPVFSLTFPNAPFTGTIKT